MRAGQRGYGLNGKQNFLFPLENMWLTQGSYIATQSHNGCYAMDFDGYLNGQFVTLCPYYAPFDCKLVAKWGPSTNYQAVWQSINEVNFIDGTHGIACVAFNHDPNIPNTPIGTIKLQGEQIGTTGTYGASADHLHIEAKKGAYESYHQNSQGTWMLTNSTWLYDLIGCNDTNMIHTYYVDHVGVRHDYPWDDFTWNIPIPVPPTPTSERKKKYPWFIIANKNQHRM